MNKKTLLTSKLAFLVVSIIFSITFFSCCSEDKVSIWDDPLIVYADSIENYHEASIGSHSKQPIGNQNIYVDFSDGLVQAYSSETNKKVIDFISQKMVGSSVTWFGLGKNHNGIGELEYANDRDIYNKVISVSSYVDIMAPIEETLKKISSSSNDALLITDFEEYTPDGREQKFAYAKDYFTKWVEAGNSITIYYSKYTETNNKSKLSGDKNLYFVLFNYGKVNENSLLTKFENAIEGRGSELMGLNKFEINANPFSISNEYGGKDKTGLEMDPEVEPATALEVGDQEGALLDYRNGFLNGAKAFEAFEFGQSLNDLFYFYFKEKRKFSKKLFLDASQSSPYILKDIDVQVTDVTEDYINYIKILEAKKNVPVLEKDPGNNNVWDEESKNNLIIQECYVENTKNLKGEYNKYQHNPTEPIAEIFDFDVNIFASRLKNSPKEVELVTIFHKNFAGKYNVDKQIILRVDYVVKSTDINYSTQLDSFKWNSVISKNEVNSSLYESIRNTLQTVKPKGILYSYYLKLEPNKNKN
jgi:hypothetical protein